MNVEINIMCKVEESDKDRSLCLLCRKLRRRIEAEPHLRLPFGLRRLSSVIIVAPLFSFLPPALPLAFRGFFFPEQTVCATAEERSKKAKIYTSIKDDTAALEGQ